MTITPQETALGRAIAAAKPKGNKRELARRLSAIGKPITSQAISRWREAPANRVEDIERVTGVPRWELRPDLYAPPAASEAVAAE